MSLNQTTDNELSIKKILKIEVGKLKNNNVPQTFHEEKELLKIKNKKYENSLKNYFKLKKFNFKCKTWNDRCKLICKKIIINLLAIFSNLLAFYLYYLSLEGCFERLSQCIPLLSTMFLGRILIFGILSSLLITIELYLIINKIIYVYHIIYIIIFYITIYRYDHGTKLDYHGLYNFVLTIFFILIFSIIIGIINLIIYIKKSGNVIYRNIVLLLLLYVSIKIFLFSLSLRDSCKNWDKGLNSTILDNSADYYNCNIIYPKKCYIYNLNDLFDLSHHFNKKCSIKSKQENEHNNFIKYLKLEQKLTSISEMNHFGLPRTVNNPILRITNSDYYKIHDFVYKNIILMDLYNKNKTLYYNNSMEPEVEIFYDKKSKIRTAKINLHKNETLSNKRNEIANSPNNTNISLFNNIMIIYIDCISRQHFLRKMKKTSAFIEKFMKYNNEFGVSAYQFMKYQTFAHWTEPNIFPMFYSSRDTFGRKVNIIKYLKENGYITAHSGNLCSKESFEADQSEFSSRRISTEEYDHENIAMFCDPNYSSEDSPYPIFSGPYGILRKCLFGLDSFEYLIEFGKQFWNKYKNNKKYLRLSFQDGHEPTGQVVKFLDGGLYNYLNELYEKKLLNDTALFILSDHGNSYFNYIYYYILKSDDSMIERGYGTLFIILPSNKKNLFNETYYDNLYKNQQTLISPFDIHDTLINIIFGNITLGIEEIYSHYGNSLFSDFDRKIRNCSKWQGFILRKEECLCKNNTLI